MSYERDSSQDLVYNSSTGEYEAASNTMYISNLSNGTDTYVIKDANALHSAEEALPSQSGQSGKFLTTNGTSTSWADAPTELPSQTGNNGKFLTTNGTTASWGDALKNKATGTWSLSIEGEVVTTEFAVAVGEGSSAGNQGVAVGIQASAGNGSIAIGRSASTTANYGVAIGKEAATSAVGAIVLGHGTNSEADTFKVALTHSSTQAIDESTGLYTLLNSNGKIPDARLNNPIPSQTSQSGKFLTTNGTAVSWASISVMTGADGTNAGTSGLTPQPAATDNTKFLKGDGTWADVPVATFYWNE